MECYEYKLTLKKLPKLVIQYKKTKQTFKAFCSIKQDLYNNPENRIVII